MTKSQKRAMLLAKSVVCTLLFTIPMTTQATNGYFLIGYGAKSRAMGGVGIAFPQDAMAASANPAGMAEVDSGVVIGGEFFNPPRRVAAENGVFEFQTPSKNATVVDESKSGSNIFLIPSMGGVYKFNRKISMGMTVIGNGANTRYPYEENFYSLTGLPPNETYGTLGVQLLQMQMLPTLTYRPNNNHAVGASLTVSVQQFRAYGLENFSKNEFQFSSDNDHLTNKGNDYSYGAGVRLGWLGKFFKQRLNLGAYYASRTYMTEFDKYSGLFAEQGDFDIPEHYGVGLAIRATDNLVIAADIQQILYSDIASIGNDHPNTSLNDPCTRPISWNGGCVTPGASPVPSSQAMGEDDGFGFGWDDATIYKIGIAYKLNNNWILRAGYNHGDSVIPDDKLLLSMLAPAVIEDHATLGFSYNLDKKSSIDVSYVYGFKNSQTCEVNKGCKTMLTQDPGSYVAAEMEIHALGASFQYRF